MFWYFVHCGFFYFCILIFNVFYWNVTPQDYCDFWCPLKPCFQVECHSGFLVQLCSAVVSESWFPLPLPLSLLILNLFFCSSFTEIWLTGRLYTFKVYIVMVWYIYLLWNDYHKGVNTSSTSHNYPCVCVW